MRLVEAVARALEPKVRAHAASLESTHETPAPSIAYATTALRLRYATMYVDLYCDSRAELACDHASASEIESPVPHAAVVSVNELFERTELLRGVKWSSVATLATRPAFAPPPARFHSTSLSPMKWSRVAGLPAIHSTVVLAYSRSSYSSVTTGRSSPPGALNATAHSCENALKLAPPPQQSCAYALTMSPAGVSSSSFELGTTVVYSASATTLCPSAAPSLSAVTNLQSSHCQYHTAQPSWSIATSPTHLPSA